MQNRLLRKAGSKAGAVALKKGSGAIKKLAPAIEAAAAAGVGLAAGWITYSNVAIDHNVLLPEAIQADRKAFNSGAAGLVSYYASERENTRPLVLVHSINAAACSIEMSPLFNHYRESRSVYSIDLPGFGFSDRADRRYTPALYQAAIIDFLKSQVKQPADVVALSLSSEFAATAAFMEPDLFHSLVLISPTGLNKKKRQGSQKLGENNQGNTAHKLLSVPLWARPLYDLITTKASIRYFLQMSMAMPVPPEMVQYDFLTAHQPGAENAPLYFLSGMLFTPGISNLVYERMQKTPVLVLYDEDAFTNFDLLPEVLDLNSHWKAVRVAPSRGLPQWDNYTATIQTLDNYWSNLP